MATMKTYCSPYTYIRPATDSICSREPQTQKSQDVNKWKTHVVFGRKSGKLLSYRVKSAPVKKSSSKRLSTLSLEEFNNCSKLHHVYRKDNKYQRQKSTLTIQDNASDHKHNITEDRTNSQNSSSTRRRFTNSSGQSERSVTSPSFLDTRTFQNIYQLYSVQSSHTFRPHVQQRFPTTEEDTADVNATQNYKGGRSLRRGSHANSNNNLFFQNGVVSRAGSRKNSVSMGSGGNLLSRSNSQAFLFSDKGSGYNSNHGSRRGSLIRTNSQALLSEAGSPRLAAIKQEDSVFTYTSSPGSCNGKTTKSKQNQFTGSSGSERRGSCAMNDQHSLAKGLQQTNNTISQLLNYEMSKLSIPE